MHHFNHEQLFLDISILFHTYPECSTLFLLFVGSSHGKCATFPGRRGAVPPAAGADARHGGVARVPAAPVPIAGRFGELASAARWGRLGEKRLI